MWYQTCLLMEPNICSSSVKGSQKWINLCSVIMFQSFILIGNDLEVNEYPSFNVSQFKVSGYQKHFGNYF